MSSPPTPKIEILDDEENIVNLEGEEDTNDKYLSTLSTNDEDLNNYVQLFDLYPQILRKCSREFKKTFGVVNEIEYENGNTFEGKIVNDMLHGHGEFHWDETGLVYIGDFIENKITGRGKIIWPNKSEYIGDVVDGIRHGFGTYTDSNGLQYTGQWKNGKKQGKGRLNYTTDGSIHYDGEWDSGLRHGYGVYHYSNRATYEGQWKDGKRHGEGTMHWSDRDEIYTGSWVDGKQDGLGCHAWHILRVRTSQYSLPNVYDGQWANGKRNGLGTFHYPNGSKYVGYWKDDLKHGKGTLILKDGRIFERTFYKDRLIDETSDSLPSSVDQLSLERLDTRIPLVTECLSDPIEKNSVLKDTSDSNLLENYLKPHISPSDYTHSELQNMQNVITAYLTPLRSIYRFYGKLGMKQLPDNTIILRYVQFCQFLKDCKLHQHTSLAALDRIVAVSYGSEDGDDSCVQNPEKLISFGTFVNILVILACNLYTQEESYVHEKITKSKPSDALLCLLTQAIISNACKLSGVIYQDNEKSKEIHVFLQPLYQAYKFLVRIKRKFQKSIHPPPYTMTVRNFLFILKDFNLLNRKLTVKDVLEAVCKCNPVVGTIEEYNSDAELTFFDFFEALIHCTLILMLEKDEPQVDSVDNKIKTIKSDLTIKLNRRLSRRPSTSRQLKSNTGKKQKEKKSKTKRGAENRKISISPEIDKSENQKKHQMG
ncbi:Alsin [Schistosoma haematobium]|uniref:Alsin n=1 Tax=Schistosoma haematobium TaxID=6185 RepID=A0A922LSC7_SCHHA|nr:Alsin [Schistosoma haematobium]KAH9592382.1 Alsin [Schistosoma haematobium]